jgi:spermidine synthase
MEMNNISIRIIKAADASAIVELYKDAGWWRQRYSTDFIPELVSNSFCFAGAYDGERMVGMGRAVSEGVSDAYIQDVVVLKAYRKQGIGGKIIQALIDYLSAHDVDWIGLIGEPGTKSFYEELGFQEMRDYIPMVYCGKHNKDDL